MQKKIKIITLIYLLFFTITLVYSQNEDTLSYNLSISDLQQINLAPDTSHFTYEPTYDIPISDLMKLKIIKEMNVDTTFSASYNMPLSDLMKMKIQIHKNETTLKPSYDMSLKGIMEVITNEKYGIKTKIKLSYDLSLDGVMNITIIKNQQ